MEKNQDSFELEDMKRQIRLLKEKLDKETIISEKMIIQSIREKISYINRKNRGIYILVPVMIIYCNIFFIRLDYSWMFSVVTSLFLIAACLYHRYSQKGVNAKDISTDNLVNVSKALIRMNHLGSKWFYFSIPFLLFWMTWFVLESYPKESGRPILIGVLVGAVVGCVAGLQHTRNVRRKAKEAIRDIEEYTREE